MSSLSDEKLDPLPEDYWRRRRSFGIGGAGNIRSHEEATVPEHPDNASTGRRRSSVWSHRSGSVDTPSSPKFVTKVKNLFSSSPKEQHEKEHE